MNRLSNEYTKNVFEIEEEKQKRKTTSDYAKVKDINVVSWEQLKELEEKKCREKSF